MRTAATPDRASATGTFGPPQTWAFPIRTTLPATEPSTLPPVSAARSTTTEPGFIASTISRGHQHRRLPAGHGRGGDQGIGIGDVRREQLALPGRPVLGHLARVAARTFQGLEVELDGLGAHRADLLGGGRADVVRLDHGAEPLGRGDRLETGDTGAEDDDLGRLDGAGGGHVQREEAAQQACGDERRSGNPATNACEESASIDCAREIRGTSSIAKAVMLRSRRSATRLSS